MISIKNNLAIHKGFTLVEMVVALGIFMIFLAAVLSTFINLTTTQQKTNLNREAVSEVKSIVNQISTEAREKALDYNCYDVECNIATTLALISPDGLNRTLITTTCDDDLCDMFLEKQTRPATYTTAWPPGEKTQLNSPNLKILGVKFDMIPRDDPFNIGNGENPYQYQESLQYQPVFHLILNIARNSQAIDAESDPIIIQTSISSRLYNSL